MSTEFEMLAFELPGFELTGSELPGSEIDRERAIRRAGAVRAPRPAPGRGRPGRPRWPRWPHWPHWSASGGWPYPPLAPWPEPDPEPEPWPDPDPDPDPYPYPAQDDQRQYEQAQYEQPQSIAPALARMGGAAPGYQSYGPLREAVVRLGPAVAGLYLIEFDGPAGKRAYSGQSENVRRRLQQHLLCASMLGLDVARHRVFVAVAASAAARRKAEKDLHAQMGVGGRSGTARSVLTNQRRELEAGLLGESWG
jgi:hypothetical protein